MCTICVVNPFITHRIQHVTSTITSLSWLTRTLRPQSYGGVCKLRKEGPRKGPAWPMAQARLHCPAQAASASFCPARSGPAAPQSPPRPRDGAFPDSDTVWQCEAVVALGRSPDSPKERRGPPSLREWGTGLFGDLELWVAPGRRSLRGKLGLQ